jgi:hypothetical protein
MKSSGPHGGGPSPAADITWFDTMKSRAGTRSSDRQASVAGLFQPYDVRCGGIREVGFAQETW